MQDMEMEFIREKQTSIVAILTRLKVDIWYEHIYSTQPELSCFARFFILYIIWFLLQILIKTSDKNYSFLGLPLHLLFSTCPVSLIFLDTNCTPC